MVESSLDMLISVMLIKRKICNDLTLFHCFCRTSKSVHRTNIKSDDMNGSYLKINARISFLGGLIEVGGSANFVRDSNVLSTDETFTLAFLSTAYSDVIPTSTTVTYPKLCDSKATHVVNKIKYGQNAYFFFKHSKKSSFEKQEVGGSLQVVVKSIPGFAIEGSASVQLNGEEKKLSESLEVRFNGDFTFKNGIPTTFEGSINAFQELSSEVLYKKKILFV